MISGILKRLQTRPPADAQTDSLADALVEREWDFFQETHNRGGRASCQDDPATFAIMRKSQFVCWPMDALQGYAADLDQALAEGRNPVMEKYAYMMRRTHPAEFAAMAHLLPAISARKQDLVHDIVAANMAWEEECTRLYPHVRAAGRPLRSSSDTACATSFETYLEGELCTYGEATLEALHKHVLAAREQGQNLAERTLDAMAQFYGFASIGELEARKAQGRI